MKKIFLGIFTLSILASTFTSCKNEGCTDKKATNYDADAKKDDGSCEYNKSNDISTLADKFYHTTTTFSIGDEVITITTTDEPDHKSMYYPTGHALYEAYDEPGEPNFNKNPNEIGAQNYVFTIPRYPSEASTKTATGFDAIGVTVNGITIYNQEAAPGDDILDEVYTFDQYEGHPAGTRYHYHNEPVWLTQTLGNDALIGILLDGFPVYGTHENGVQLTNDDLDDYHGHTSATAEFPDGIYHYHLTDDLPWINGGSYFGTAGSFTN